MAGRDPLPAVDLLARGVFNSTVDKTLPLERFAEAWAGLLAAERGDTSRLDAALAYFEEQRATPYVQRCRALLRASA